MIVGLDTMILIWGFCGNPSPRDIEHQREMKRRARILLVDLSKRQDTIVVSAITVAELLVKIPKQDHGKFIATLQDYFYCPSYELPTCSHAADINSRYLDSIRQSGGAAVHGGRDLIKADTLIVASALSAGAEVFYSHDDRCRKIATMAGIVAKDLPSHSENLYEEAKIQAGEIPEIDRPTTKPSLPKGKPKRS